MPEPRITFNLPFDEYRALDGLNWSTLKHATISPAHYAAAVEDRLDDEDTASRGMLRACHAAALEPDVYAHDFEVFDGVRRGAAYEAAKAANPNRTMLNAREHLQAQAVGRAVRAHPVVAPLVGHKLARPEATLEWTEDGHACKGRIDLLVRLPDRWIVADLKAVPSIAPRKLASETARRLYHAQLAHYCAGVAALIEAGRLTRLPIEARIIAYETRPLIDVAVVSLGLYDEGEAIYCGQAVRRAALEVAAAYDPKGQPRGQAPELTTLALPSWAYDESDEEVTEG